MCADIGIVFELDEIAFDPHGRVVVSDKAAGVRIMELLAEADAISCRSGCGAPLSCDTALITRTEAVRIGRDVLVNNPDFAAIIRKRKAVGAGEAVIVFSVYKKMETTAA
jgi:hypothetical protein